MWWIEGQHTYCIPPQKNNWKIVKKWKPASKIAYLQSANEIEVAGFASLQKYACEINCCVEATLKYNLCMTVCFEGNCCQSGHRLMLLSYQQRPECQSGLSFRGGRLQLNLMKKGLSFRNRSWSFFYLWCDKRYPYICLNFNHQFIYLLWFIETV